MKVFRPTKLDIEPNGYGFNVITYKDNVRVVIFEYSVINATLSLEKAEEFAQYLIEYYNHNHNG
tara:strand:+ start:436 stop:627 length:192 start_codon:yes stop_codon:yes gene_type:complete